MTGAAEIIAGLGGNESTGKCPCPAHDDEKPSLHVTEGQNGRPLVKCFAGCSQEAVIDALRERSLWSGGKDKTRPILRPRHTRRKPSDEFERSLRAWKILRAAARSKERPAPYLRNRGIDLMPENAMVLSPDDSARLTGKDDRPGRRFPAMVLPVIKDELLVGAHVTWLARDGKIKVKTKGQARLTYGHIGGGYIPLAPVDPDQPLVVGEGVETTLSAMKLADAPGVALISAGNFQTVVVPKCSEVLIAADNDPPGRKAAARLAERLEYEGRRVRIALPPLPRNAGEDARSDWNDRLLDADEPEAEWRTAIETDAPREASGPVLALTEDEFMKLKFPKRELYLSPWLPRAGLVMIHAPKGEGKTWFALSVGKAIAGGNDLMGWPCRNHGRVLYLDGELPGASVQERLSRFRRSPPEMFHILCRDAFLLRRELVPNIGEPEGRRELDRIIEQCNSDVVILDSLSTLLRSGIENDAESWQPIQDWLMKHRWQGRTMVVVHHDNKSGKQRGTSKREDVMDTMVQLKKRPAEDAEPDESVFELTFTKTRDFFGADAEPILLHFVIEDGLARWSHEPIRNEQREQVRDMLDAGMTNKEIARELKVTAGRVSQITKELKND